MRSNNVISDINYTYDIKCKEFDIGDLIELRKGIPSYPYFDSLASFKKGQRLNILRFGNEQLVVLEKIYDENKTLIGYECLCNKEKLLVMDIKDKDLSLDAGFCYVKI